MKILTQRILARRKIILIFLLAILLPSLIVGYLSLSTFAKGREAVRKFLETNLWISGEAALKSIEAELLQYEKQALKSKNFIPLLQSTKSEKSPFQYSELSEEIIEHPFLLDANYQIIFPETGSDDTSIFQWEKDLSASEFARSLQRAEYFEFSQKNYTKAAELYEKCSMSSPSDQHRAIALEGLGRCLLALKKHVEGYKIYSELSSTYGQFMNKAGHPYGIVVAFQLYEIEKLRQLEEKGLEILLDVYEKIRNGFWLLNLPAYDFFIAQIESILVSKFNNGKFSEIQKSYHSLRKKHSPYLQTLLFTDFLKKEAFSRIKEKLELSRMGKETQAGRMLASRGENFCLISFRLFPDLQAGKIVYGGFCWDLDVLKKEIFPKIMGDITRDSGLNIQIIDESSQNILTGEEKLASKDSIALSYRQFPFPWKISVSQPAFRDLERTARRENFFYGMLLCVIVVLMILGVILIARDISRESETTQLKTEFVHNISHELKTPLTLIRLYGETLQRKEDLKKEERKEAYEIITKESERLSHLINNVLDFSRIEMGRKEFDFRKGNFVKIVCDTLESYRYHLEKKGFSIHKEIATDIPEMSFDTEAIASVLVNLLSNAMKFSLKKKEVTVKLFKDNGNAILQVADKGIGILPIDTSRIFKRFYRVKNEIVSETRGSGLGLTLVQHITEAHGGQVKVESEPGKGSTFSIILPISSPKKG